MKDRREPVVVIGKRYAEKRHVGDLADAGIAVGQVDPVYEDETDDLAERQRHNRQIVAPEPEDGKPQNDSPHRREHARQRQADPEREAEGGRQKSIGISANRVEGDVSEIEQAGEADHDVQPPAQHHVDQNLDAVIVDPLEGSLRPEKAKRDEREQDDETEREGTEIPTELSPGARRRGRALALPRRLRQRAAHAPGDDRADAVEPDPPVRAGHLA